MGFHADDFRGHCRNVEIIFFWSTERSKFDRKQITQNVIIKLLYIEIRIVHDICMQASVLIGIEAKQLDLKR